PRGSGRRRDADPREARLHRDPAPRERLTDQRAVVRYRNPLDRQLAERQLELLDDLRPLVGPADDRAQVARLLVVETDHLRRLVVVLVTEEVDLADAVVVEDDR